VLDHAPDSLCCSVHKSGTNALLPVLVRTMKATEESVRPANCRILAKNPATYPSSISGAPLPANVTQAEIENLNAKYHYQVQYSALQFTSSLRR
jgi:hypothetical protein